MDTHQLLQSLIGAATAHNALEGTASQQIFFAAMGQLSGQTIRITPRDKEAPHVIDLLQQQYQERLCLHEVYGFGLAKDTFKEEAKRHWRTCGHLMTLDGHPILAVRCHEDGETAVQVLHQTAVSQLCHAITLGLQAVMQRHISMQNLSFNASAFFSDYRRVFPHGGGFFQLHTPREIEDFAALTQRYRMYLLGTHRTPTRLLRFVDWQHPTGTLARFTCEGTDNAASAEVVTEVVVDACDVLLYAGAQEDGTRLLKLAERAARPTSWSIRQRIHYDPFDASPYSVVLEQTFHGHLRVETTWVYFVQEAQAVAFCQRFKGTQMGQIDALAPEYLIALAVTKLEGPALGQLQGVKLAPAPERMRWSKV